MLVETPGRNCLLFHVSSNWQALPRWSVHKQYQSLWQGLACLALSSPNFIIIKKNNNSALENFLYLSIKQSLSVSSTFQMLLAAQQSFGPSQTGYIQYTNKEIYCTHSWVELLWCIIRPCEHGWCCNGKQSVLHQIPSCFRCSLGLLRDKLWFIFFYLPILCMIKNLGITSRFLLT